LNLSCVVHRLSPCFKVGARHHVCCLDSVRDHCAWVPSCASCALDTPRCRPSAALHLWVTLAVSMWDRSCLPPHIVLRCVAAGRVMRVPGWGCVGPCTRPDENTFCLASSPPCKVRMARGGVNSLFKNLQATLNNHVSIKDG
jgi:hypothetical protein